MSVAKGVSKLANNKEIGTETTVPIKEPAAIFFIVIVDKPRFFKYRACSIIGLDKTPPGNPTRAVGMALVKFNVMIAEIKKVKIIIGAVPAKTSANETGTRTEVSSVPGIKPIKVYNTTADSEATTI